MSYYFNQEKIIFIHIPKNAGTSFKTWSQENLKDRFTKYKTHVDIFYFDNKSLDFEKSFCFVRNPYDRLISLFNYIGQSSKDRILKNSFKKNISPEQDKELLNYYKLGFNNWVQDLYYNKPNPYNKGWEIAPHNKNQIDYIKKETIVLKLENLNEEFKVIQKLFNCYEPMLIKNQSSHKKRYEVYNENTVEMVSEIFKKDLQELKYSF